MSDRTQQNKNQRQLIDRSIWWKFSADSESTWLINEVKLCFRFRLISFYSGMYFPETNKHIMRNSPSLCLVKRCSFIVSSPFTFSLLFCAVPTPQLHHNRNSIYMFSASFIALRLYEANLGNAKEPQNTFSY